MKRASIACVALLTGVSVLAQQIDIGPPPGRPIDVGGRKLHLNCTGSGSPTVVLEAGSSSFAIDWSLVQPEVARTRRVCSQGLAENHAGLARLSRNSRQTVVSTAGHEIHLFSPAAVIQAIQDVCTAARQRSQLPSRP